jgi:UDP-N-acetylmuramate dehydrogenase
VVSALDALAAALGDRARHDAPLGARTTYRVGGRARLHVEADSEDDLVAVHDALARCGEAVPLLVLGAGSNLLVADAGFSGLVVSLGEGFAAIEVTGTVVRAGAAAPFPVVARRSAAAGLHGLEWAVGVPGSVGGAVRMNAGGHGAQTADVILGARVFDLGDSRFRDMSRAELGLAYRRSALSPRAVVVAATFTGGRDAPAACAGRIDEIVRWRREHQPGGQNAGSVFTNPPGDSAGRLIEAAACKGVRVGGAVVSEKHANFFVADAGARAADVFELIELVRQRVYETTGVELETELHLVGFVPRGGTRTNAEAS